MNIAPEGRKILSGLLVVTSGLLLTGMFTDFGWATIIAAVSGLLFLFSLNFFRDPSRTVPQGNGIIIAPADGKVTNVTKIDDPDVGEGSHLVTIFLNIFNVHANRVPLDGEVVSVKRRSGQFVSAFRHDAGDVNEQMTTIFKTSIGPIKVTQIAGLVARRILCYAEKGEQMSIGDRLGFIMFGSRTDIIFPPNVDVKVKQGQKVAGTETIIGKFVEEK